MEKLFLRILQMSLSGAVVILAILPLRLMLRRAPRKYSYLLWLAAAFRLCVPVSLPSPVSLFRLLEQPAAGNGAAALPLGLALPGETGSAAATALAPVAAPETAAPAASFPWLTLLAWVWLGIAALFLLYGLLSSLWLRRRLSTSIRLEGNVYRAEGIRSPFLLGFFRPRIYVPWDLEGADLEYALAHERCHLRRGDQCLRLLAWVLRCVHWFNPLVWLAWSLMGRDMELSCDEAVLSRLGDVRGAYGKSLVHMALRGRGHTTPTSPAFGETGVSQRVKNVLRWKKARAWVTVCALLLCVLFTAAWITDPMTSRLLAPELTVNPDGTVGSLEWGMSPEEVMAADGRIEMTESLNDFYAFAELKGARVLGYTADIGLTFSKRKLEDGIKRGPDGRPTLDGIHIYIPGEVSVTEALTAVFGEIEKRKPSDNEWDIVDEVPVLRWLPGELPEDKWYWHTDPVYTDIPMEHLRLSIPWYEDATLLGAWCSTFGCKVYVDTFESEEGMTTDISFIGYGYALKRFLAEEYQRMTEVDQDG